MKTKFQSVIYKFLKSTFGKILIVPLGNFLVWLNPKKASQLSESGLTIVNANDNMGITERLMRSAILRKVEKTQDYNTLETLHKNYWTNKGADFFTETENSFEKEFLPNCAFIFDELEKTLSNSTNQYNTLVEIGTGNGRVLNYLSSRFSNINHFIGIDLSSEQIEINNKKFSADTRLEFVASDGFDWAKKYGQGNTVFVTSRGVLEYFTEKRLQAFLKEINALGKTIFVAIEPIGTDHNYKTNPNSQPYGPERSFSHNYALQFETAGFSIWHLSYKPFNKAASQCFIGAMN